MRSWGLGFLWRGNLWWRWREVGRESQRRVQQMQREKRFKPEGFKFDKLDWELLLSEPELHLRMVWKVLIILCRDLWLLVDHQVAGRFKDNYIGCQATLLTTCKIASKDH